MKGFSLLIVLGCGVYCAAAGHTTPAEQCQGGKIEDIKDRIEILPCGKKRCTLRRGTNTTVNFKFNTKHEVTTLSNHVYGELGGIPLPFIGVDGQNACEDVKLAETGEPAPCPLEPHKEYLYSFTFPVLDIYPLIEVRVHWALTDGSRDVMCFEVPTIIKAHK